MIQCLPSALTALSPFFAFPVAVIVFITQPFVVFCLSQMDREKGFSKTREVLEYALLFPATVFDFIR